MVRKRAVVIARVSRKDQIAIDVLGGEGRNQQTGAESRGQKKNKIKGIYQTAVYVRLSMEEETPKEGDSIATQLSMLMEYIRLRPELRLYSVYMDNGKTGTNFRRPAFNRMMQDMRERKIDCILVKDFSRFGRNYLEAGEYLEQVFPAWGVRFIAVNDGYDSENPNGREEVLTVMLRNLVNDVYSKDISRKVRSVFLMKQREGQYLGNYPPYGYQRDPADKHHLIPEGQSAGIVRIIFEWKYEGMRAAWIVQTLNHLGIESIQKYHQRMGMIEKQTTREMSWNKRTLGRMLRNPIYLGHMVQGRDVSELYRGIQRKRTAEEDWIIVYNTHEPILSQELFDGVQKRIIGRRPIER